MAAHRARGSRTTLQKAFMDALLDALLDGRAAAAQITCGRQKSSMFRLKHELAAPGSRTFEAIAGDPHHPRRPSGYRRVGLGALSPTRTTARSGEQTTQIVIQMFRPCDVFFFCDVFPSTGYSTV